MSKIETRQEKERAWQLDRLEIVRPWIEEMFAAHARDDFLRFIVTPASELEDFSTLYPPVDPSVAQILFRARAAERSNKGGKQIREVTFREVGERGQHEYDKVIAGCGDYFVTAFFNGPTVTEAIFGDAWKLRAMMPRRRKNMAKTGRAAVPFIGLDCAALMEHGVGLAAYPVDDIFLQLREPPMEGQEALL